MNRANQVPENKDGHMKSLSNKNQYSVFEFAAGKELNNRMKELMEYATHLERVIAEQNRELSGVVTRNSKFISIIAHDLRSPFISILGIMDMIRDYFQQNEDDDLEKYINIARDSASSTLGLLDNLTAWAVSQLDDRAIQPETMNLLDLLNDEIRIINCSAVQKEISLNVSIPADMKIYADAQMMKTVLRNLVNNAIKYSNRGDEVLISASAGIKSLDIVVKDSGTGISHEDQQKIFREDEFHSTPGTKNEKGTGLGLILCKEFVDKHGGKIRMKSEPGAGSEFIVTLPQPLTHPAPQA
jgi:signal transduction histidine kinase